MCTYKYAHTYIHTWTLSTYLPLAVLRTVKDQQIETYNHVWNQ